MRWKYTNPRQQRRTEYLRFKDGEEKELTVTNWDFTKHPAGYLFKCFVTKENGESVDKIWTIWEYDNAQHLKKKLGAKYSFGSKDLTVRWTKEDDEEPIIKIL